MGRGEFLKYQTPVDFRPFVDCWAFADDRTAACLGLAIASSAEFLRLRRLYLECESGMDGKLTAGNSSQDNPIVEVSDFQLPQAKFHLDATRGIRKL